MEKTIYRETERRNRTEEKESEKSDRRKDVYGIQGNWSREAPGGKQTQGGRKKKGSSASGIKLKRSKRKGDGNFFLGVCQSPGFGRMRVRGKY